MDDETPPPSIFLPPSINPTALLSGETYTHHSPIPTAISASPSTPCILGVDEAGRGPVLGPMVYALLYLPAPLHRPLLAQTHHFDDSKVLTPTFRTSLMKTLCQPSTDLHASCGWGVTVMSPRAISAAMMRPATYNLNAQAMDTTIALIQDVIKSGVNVAEIYIDTIGSPAAYQTRLARVFPSAKVVVAKKADSLYPCVSAASVCAKVTRDAALEVCYRAYAASSSAAMELREGQEVPAAVAEEEGWGSGYPSDVRCSTWLKRNMDPVFGWGNVCRFSWGTAKDLLEPPGGGKGKGVRVEWPVEDEDDEGMRVTDYFSSSGLEVKEGNEMLGWFGTRVGEEVF